jgi:carboxypeptidase C (cathepsin A)
VVAEAEEYAADGFPRALARGARLTAEERSAAVAKVAALTGLSEEYLDRVDLRVEHVRFYTELLRSRRRTVGRLDGRFLGWDPDYGSERWSDDPFLNAIMGPYTAAFNHYVRAELEYSNDLPYEILNMRVHPWSFKEFEGQHVIVADKLSAALRANPHMRVYVACGYYDGGTPHFAAEHTFAHLAIPAELRGNVEFAYFESGHMMYIHEPSRLDQSAQLAAFVTP